VTKEGGGDHAGTPPRVTTTDGARHGGREGGRKGRPVQQETLLHGHADTKAKCRMGRHARLRHHRPLAPTPRTHTSSSPLHMRCLSSECDKVDAWHCSRMHWGRRGRAGARGQPRRPEVPITSIYRKTRTALHTPSRTPPCAAEVLGVAERACMRKMKCLVEHRHALFACACGEAGQEEGKGEGWGSRSSNRMATRTRTRSWDEQGRSTW